MRMEDHSIDITYDPVSFRWTVPLKLYADYMYFIKFLTIVIPSGMPMCGFFLICEH
jgi:hypothetical protein